jgi:hypothetical protein
VRGINEVVADLNSAISKIGFEVGPLVDGVADGFAEFGLGQDGTPEGEFVDGFLEPAVDHPAFGGAHGLAQGGAGFGFAQAFFDVFEVGELTEDPGDQAGGLLGGFEKFTPHMKVPLPLEVEICRGEADIQQVLNDVMGLTKLNYNSCRHSDGWPVTLKFADAVGEVLISGPAISNAPLAFKHYI